MRQNNNKSTKIFPVRFPLLGRGLGGGSQNHTSTIDKRLLLDPLSITEPGNLLIFGLISLGIGTIIGMVTNTRFDGIMDVHFTENSFTVETLTDNLINVLMLTFVFSLLAKLIKLEVRMIDILNTALISRIPFYVIALFNSNGFIHRMIKETIEKLKVQHYDIPFLNISILTLFVIVTLGALSYSVYLQYKGFRGIRNKKMKGYGFFFLIGILAAEIISKFILSSI